MKRNAEKTIKEKIIREKTQKSIQAKLQAFDDKIGEMYDSDIMIMKIMYIPLIVMACVFWLISYDLDAQLIFSQCVMLVVGIGLHMGRYYKINMNGEGLKLYDMMKGFGIDKKAYIRSRRNYLLKIIMKLFVTAMILSTLGGMVSGKWTWSCIYIPVLESVILFVWAGIDLIMSIM